MEKKYKVRVNDQYDFEYTQSEIDELDSVPQHKNSFHILKDHHSFASTIISSNFLQKNYSVKLNANIYNIKISNDLDLLIEEMGLSLGTAQQINDVKAPMPGLILEVIAREGDEVEGGDYLLVLEAMKMENTLTAPGSGIIKSIHVSKGDTVEKNQLLIELE